MEELIEESLELLDKDEIAVIAAILSLLETEFNLLLRELRDLSGSGLLQFVGTSPSELELVESLPPGESDQILESIDDLFEKATKSGLDLAEQLAKPLVSNPVVASVSAGLLQSSARRTRGYIEVQARSFSESVSKAIASGLVDPTDASATAEALRRQLKILNNRVRTIIKTETARVKFQASNTYYAAQGLDLVVYYVVRSEWLCEHCAAQAGRVFKRNAIRLPRHYSCNCFLRPYGKNEFNILNSAERERRAHRREVLSYIEQRGIQINEGPAAFESLALVPIRKDAQI